MRSFARPAILAQRLVPFKFPEVPARKPARAARLPDEPGGSTGLKQNKSPPAALFFELHPFSIVWRDPMFAMTSAVRTGLYAMFALGLGLIVAPAAQAATVQL